MATFVALPRDYQCTRVKLTILVQYSKNFGTSRTFGDSESFVKHPQFFEFIRYLTLSAYSQVMHFVSRDKLFQILRSVLIGFFGVLLFLVIVYNFVFENYEVIGESVQCETNTPFAMNYSCKLDIIDNNTQYWSFESNIPEGVSIPHMMVNHCNILW